MFRFMSNCWGHARPDLGAGGFGKSQEEAAVLPLSFSIKSRLSGFQFQSSSRPGQRRHHHNWPKLIVRLISSLDATAATVSTIELCGLQPHRTWPENPGPRTQNREPNTENQIPMAVPDIDGKRLLW